ncbi:MAG: VOC family protein [Peptococcaceae bacterium]|nr:VOC family protein [Peptococcaceae bacterium]
MQAVFAHTNIIADDWRKLAKFYIDTFGCEPLPPERNHQGDWIDRVTNMKNVHISGIHLRLPGYVDGPTLEIFSYIQQPVEKENGLPALNKPGLAHIAFLVEDVPFYCNKLLRNGGSKLGEIVEKKIAGAGLLTVVYARDPEGNIIEIQNWK